MFQLVMVVLSLCLMRGGADPVVRESERGEEAGAITVKVELPKVISHIDCPPPKITRHDIEQRRNVHN